MSRWYYNTGPPIVVHDHDVLCGRGVNIALHPGNVRFRTLVTTRADADYCASYSASEKRAVAEEIIKHIKSLDPPGRFLKREGRCNGSRGLTGPWLELSERDAIKKTCQALRDCNRTDREGYATGVEMPDDVVREAERLASSGLTTKEQAAATVAAKSMQARAVALATLPLPPTALTPAVSLSSSYDATSVPTTTTTTAAATSSLATTHATYSPLAFAPPPPAFDLKKRDRHLAFGEGVVTTTTTAMDHATATTTGRISPSIENAAEWLKKQRTDDATATAAAVAASSLPELNDHHSPHDAHTMAVAAAMYNHSAADLLVAAAAPLAASPIKQNEDDEVVEDDDVHVIHESDHHHHHHHDEHDDAVEAAMDYPAPMPLGTDEVHHQDGGTTLEGF